MQHRKTPGSAPGAFRGFRKILACLGACALAAGGLAAQDGVDDSFEIPLEIDMSVAPAADPAPGAAGAKSPLSMGLWLEASQDSAFLTRDIATGEKAGLEYDSTILSTKANWWFWGPVAEGLVLDLEVGLWEADLPLYQADSYGANVPLTTLTDGVQGLAGILFAPLWGLNGEASPGINKFLAKLQGPLVAVSLGYGEVPDEKRRELTGIFSVIDQWDDAGKGFLELEAGDAPKHPGGDVNLDFLGGFSRTRGEYGMYGFVRGGFTGIFDLLVHAGSTSTSTELFRYDEQNDNAAGLMASFHPFPGLELALHGIAGFGTAQGAMAPDNSALGFRALLDLGTFRMEALQTWAGAGVSTVWGDDTSLHADAFHSLLKPALELQPGVIAGLQADLDLADAWAPVNALATLDAEPWVDLDFGKILGQGFRTRAYGRMTGERIAPATDSSQPVTAYLSEAGLAFATGRMEGLWEALDVRWALIHQPGDWDSTSASLAAGMLYNSLTLTLDLDASFALTAAALVRTDLGGADASLVPFGAGIGAWWATPWKDLGSPRLWAQAAWGLDPWKDDHRTLYRTDDPDYAADHLTWSLVDLEEATGLMHLRAGLVWDLQ